MCSGVANYVGTYWPVERQSAEAFAQTSYRELLRQRTIGAALLTGRERVCSELKSVDWADYIHYGSYDFALKRGVNGPWVLNLPIINLDEPPLMVEEVRLLHRFIHDPAGYSFVRCVLTRQRRELLPERP